MSATTWLAPIKVVTDPLLANNFLANDDTANDDTVDTAHTKKVFSAAECRNGATSNAGSAIGPNVGFAWPDFFWNSVSDGRIGICCRGVQAASSSTGCHSIRGYSA